MNDERSIPVTLPLDSDGFLRRECPTCKREFKWYQHPDGSVEAELVDQYFCPLCGQASGTDTWWTAAQLEYLERAAAPAIDQMFVDTVAQAFKGTKGFDFKANRNFSRSVPAPEPLIEPNDMHILESPCHPHEPVKVPEDAIHESHCLICGERFAR